MKTTFNPDNFTFNAKAYAHNGTRYTEDGKLIKKADYTAIAVEAKTEFDLAQAQQNPAPETPEAPAEKKEKTHPTADKFKETIPEGYRFEVNNKGHIRIFKDDAAKTAYAKLVAKKDGVNICASKELRDARSDLTWDYHEGWASKYVLKVADWAAVQEVLFPEPEEEPAQA